MKDPDNRLGQVPVLVPIEVQVVEVNVDGTHLVVVVVVACTWDLVHPVGGVQQQLNVVVRVRLQAVVVEDDSSLAKATSRVVEVAHGRDLLLLPLMKGPCVTDLSNGTTQAQTRD